MSARSWLLVAAACCAVTPAAAGGHSKDWIKRFDANPNPSSVRTIGKARFTVLTEGVVRMEYEDAGIFDDDASVTFLHRNLPTPEFTSKVKGSVLTITTSKWVLSYDSAAGPFSAASLKVNLLTEPFSTWVPGADPKGNLHGTIRTLDRVGHAVDLKCPPVTTTMIYYTVRVVFTGMADDAESIDASSCAQRFLVPVALRQHLSLTPRPLS